MRKAIWLLARSRDEHYRKSIKTVVQRFEKTGVRRLATAAEAELIGWADYLLLPSRIESIPVVFSDAMQAGTPMIATPVGDLPRLFERYEVGMLADDVSASGLQRAIISALDTEVSNYAAGVKTAAADFDVASTAQRFAQRVAGANG